MVHPYNRISKGQDVRGFQMHNESQIHAKKQNLSFFQLLLLKLLLLLK